MNNSFTINPEYLHINSFNHLATYKLLFYILANYYRNIDRCPIPKDIKDKINMSNKSIKDGIQELIDKKIIFEINGYKDNYRLNREIFRKRNY